MRPITLSNTAHKLLAKALNASLEKVAAATVHPAQRGFMPGRSMADNMFEAIAPMHVARLLEGSVPAVVLFDIRAAFPSVAWEWIWMVLRRLRVPAWLIRAVHAIYYGSWSDIVFGGCVSACGFHIRRGILQGCPASGSLWAILFDLVVRALVCAHPEPQGSLTAFADDLAAAFVNILRNFSPAMEVFVRLLLATGLQLHIPKVKVVNYSGLSDFDLRRRLHDCTAACAFGVAGSARYLGVLIGPRAGAHFWDRAIGKFAHRCVALHASPAHLANKVTRYITHCLSVLLFLGQLAPPNPQMRRVEAATVSSMCSAPVYAITPDMLASLAQLGCTVGFRTVSDSFVLPRLAWPSGRTSSTRSGTPSSRQLNPTRRSSLRAPPAG